MAQPTDPVESPDAPADDAAPQPSRTARARAKAEQLRALADEKLKDLEARRPGSRVIDAGFMTFERDVSHGGGVLAAALAFRIFIFFVPFVFVIVTAIPAAADVAGANSVNLAKDFGMTGLAASAVKSADGMSTWTRVTLLIGGLFALVLASRSLVRVLRITHGLAWSVRVPKLQRSWRAAAMLIVVVFGFVVANSVMNRVTEGFGLFGIIPRLAAGFAVVALWVVVEDHLPHQDVDWTAQIPGAIVVTLGIEVLHLVTVYWFTRYLENKTETYGAIGAAVAILLWAYFVGRIIVSGAMLNAVVWEQSQRRESGSERRRAGYPGEQRATQKSGRDTPTSRSAPPGPEEDEYASGG